MSFFYLKRHQKVIDNHILLIVLIVILVIISVAVYVCMSVCMSVERYG